ncbi:hypothetical protein CI102_12754 [Trichoderma harzianum]|uniref:Uncharacterized protein n=1 Tax=Trichoderma harzianum CBS 226.95 TaxID=983964 RepID=A0A2T3ZSK7_TRIHA|nr:hypothetical protein M431DRAFT_367869 [Trichoderma harzianum CBS 226.95]PKK42893.1 hypothetical protein CI102_12754 [Trichoderma harzianum]PTB47769.1 hypothetical protein M431DRAFT_367869 [Trichoderma harzianum CBS 226.95]
MSPRKSCRRHLSHKTSVPITNMQRGDQFVRFQSEVTYTRTIRYKMRPFIRKLACRLGLRNPDKRKFDTRRTALQCTDEMQVHTHERITYNNREQHSTVHISSVETKPPVQCWLLEPAQRYPAPCSFGRVQRYSAVCNECSPGRSWGTCASRRERHLCCVQCCSR